MENKNLLIGVLIISITLSSLFGGFFGFVAGAWYRAEGADPAQKMRSIFADKPGSDQKQAETEKVVRVEEESDIITTVEKASPAVVSIIVTKDLPIIEKYYRQPFGDSDFFSRFFGSDFGDFFSRPEYRQNGTEKREVGGGTGFIVSADGYILTNKHVVSDEDAEYTVLMNDESRHAAKVLAKDTMNDLAVLKVEGKDMPYIELGDSTNLKVGQSVITIGNALAEFRNTVSTGVVSGLRRNITAGGSGIGSEDLVDVIQTDAAINPGNSGGPLLDLSGRAIGINTAIAQGAENIGFAIPINAVKSVYESVKKNGRIVHPWLGIRYVLIDEEIAKANNLSVSDGALIARGENRTDLAVIPGSPADKAGLVENDIVLEIDGEKISRDNQLSRLISKHRVGDEIELKIWRKGEEKKLKVKLEEMKSE